MKHATIRRNPNLRYNGIREQLPSILTTIKMMDDTNPRILLEDRCYNGLTGMKRVAEKVPHNAKDLEYKVPFFPAIEDINALEGKLAYVYGTESLLETAKYTPVVLHRMGYFENWGIRDLFLIGEPECGKTVIRHSVRSEESIVFKPEDDITETTGLEEGIKKHIKSILKNNPFCELVMHVLGSEFKFGIAEEFIPDLPEEEYLQLSRQADRIVMLPPQIIAALLKVSENEQERINNSPRAKYELLGFHPHEKKDKSHYMIIVMGKNGTEVKGFGSLSEMTEIAKQIDIDRYSFGFAHGYGSPIDPELFFKMVHGEV